MIEATSALDAESEGQVQLALDNLMAERGSTILLVAHRLSTVMNADQICVVDNGTIVEHGTHEELFNARGAYFRLVQRQIRKKRNVISEEGDEGATGAGGGPGTGGNAFEEKVEEEDDEE